jgi:hypothetical protein
MLSAGLCINNEWKTNQRFSLNFAKNQNGIVGKSDVELASTSATDRNLRIRMLRKKRAEQ